VNLRPRLLTLLPWSLPEKRNIRNTIASSNGGANNGVTFVSLLLLQGAQAVGMGKDVHTVPAAAALFAKANEILGWDFEDLFAASSLCASRLYASHSCVPF
jgi:hypothetical protein